MYKESFCLFAATLLLLAGIAFSIAGFIVPPPGEVSDSVLMLVAQCFIASGSFAGIKVLAGKNTKSNG